MNSTHTREQYRAQLESGWRNLEMRLEKTEGPYRVGQPKIVKLVFINHSSEPVALFHCSLIDHFDIEAIDDLARSVPPTEWMEQKRISPREGGPPAPKVPGHQRLELRLNLDIYLEFSSPGMFLVNIKARPKSFGEHMKNSSSSITIEVEENEDSQ